jgi:hypothetical protein
MCEAALRFRSKNMLDCACQGTKRPACAGCTEQAEPRGKEGPVPARETHGNRELPQTTTSYLVIGNVVFSEHGCIRGRIRGGSNAN